MTISVNPTTSELVRFRLQELRYPRSALPFEVTSPSVQVLGGDWDISLETFDRVNGGSCKFVDIAESSCAEDSIPVAIGRHGDVIVIGTNRVCEQGAEVVRLRTVGRHVDWERFRQEIVNYGHAQADGLVYAPLSHPDLRDIPAWTTHKRADRIRSSITHSGLRVIDFGAHWGYMCEVLEKSGHDCVAMESDPESYNILTRLRRARHLSYKSIHCDICDCNSSMLEADVALALAIFHHLNKTRQGHQRLIEFLRRLRIREMFFWANNAYESQMNDAFANFEPDDFADFIVANSCLSSWKCIGTEQYRRLYHITA